MIHTEGLGARWQTLESEQLKSAAELGLHALAGFAGPDSALWDRVRGGERVEDGRLHIELAGMELENPLIVGAGWDKKGRAVDGLHALGFAGAEVGSVLVFPQAGSQRPRMWYKGGAGYNRLGFNSPGQEVVAENLEQQRREGIVGISLGKNKLLPDDKAPWAHAAVAERLHAYGDYFVINVASPNTPGLRGLLKRGPLTDIINETQDTLLRNGNKPLFVKTTVDLAPEDLDEVLEVCVGQGVTGIIDSNTTIAEELKARYGWSGMGGVSGDVPEFRQQATERMRHITRETRGTGLQRIGVGAINSAEAAWERMEAGAQALQVVTAIRQHGGRVARKINSGLVAQMEREGVATIGDIIGTAT